MNAAQAAADLQARQAQANAAAANANQGGGFWDALGGMAIGGLTSGLTGGLTSGLSSGLSNWGKGLFSNTSGGIPDDWLR